MQQQILEQAIATVAKEAGCHPVGREMENFEFVEALAQIQARLQWLSLQHEKVRAAAHEASNLLQSPCEVSDCPECEAFYTLQEALRNA